MGRNSGGVRGSGTQGNSIEERAAVKIRGILADIETKGFSRQQPFSIGKVEQRMKDYAKEHNITLGSDDVYMSASSISHATRDFKKNIGKAVTNEELENFPTNRHNMEMKYLNGAFIFSDQNAEYVVKPNYELKINRKNARHVVFITATRKK